MSSIKVKTLNELKREKDEKLAQEKVEETGLQTVQKDLRRELLRRMLAEKAVFDGRLKESKGDGDEEDSKVRSTQSKTSRLSNGEEPTGALENRGLGDGESRKRRPTRPRDLDIHSRKKAKKTGMHQQNHSKKMPKSLKSTWRESRPDSQSEVSDVM